MSKEFTKPISPDFDVAAHPSLAEQTDRKIETRNASFYGAVFNALDDYFRKGHAFAVADSDFSTAYQTGTDQFHFLITPARKDDSLSEDPHDAIRSFFNEVHVIIERKALENIKGLVRFDQTTAPPAQYMLSATNKSELMELLEKLLEPYDFEDNCLPTFRHTGVTKTSPMCFSMFPQYSLKHIRTLFYNIQGRGFKNQGLYLNH